MLCPRQCGANRIQHVGACGAGDLPRIARAALHFWEEPCISGTRGSGAVFFGGCNLRCVFCQNYQINTGALGSVCDASRLADLYLDLQQQGAHNINLVTPAPHVDAIAASLEIAGKRGLNIPIVYNTNAYERADVLRQLEGLIDIYLPDFKYISSDLSARYSGAGDYFTYAAPAIEEMYRQVGTLAFDNEGIAQKGLLIRHLVLPGSVDETRRVLDYIHDHFPIETWISLMSQYVPAHKADFAPLNRRLTAREYDRAVSYCLQLGLENVFIQEKASADASYTPAFYKELP